MNKPSRARPRIRVLPKPFDAKSAQRHWSRGGDEKPTLSGVVALYLDDVIGCDVEKFNDLVSRRLTGDEYLMDISYRVVGVRGQRILVMVTGDASECVPNEEAPGGEGAAADLARELRTVHGVDESDLDQAVHEAFAARAARKNDESDGTRDTANHDDASRKASAVNDEGLEAQVAYLLAQGYSCDEIRKLALED